MIESRLSRKDYDEFLLVCYFGSKGDYLSRCINRAYRDFNRTMHGFGDLDEKLVAHAQAAEYIHERLLQLSKLKPISCVQFDDWHRQSCETLIAVYRSKNFPSFYVGQAQKWLNMTLKYIFTMGAKRIAGFDACYAFCHVPFDNILIAQLSKYGFPSISTAWSRMNDYDGYLSRQQWIRERFQLLPLDVEFLLWMGKSPD